MRYSDMSLPHWLERTELLMGKEALESLQTKNVLIVGLGGVGSFAAEFLCRGGVGKMTIVDGDVVDPTNINRQLPAVHSTVGQYKVDLVKARLLDINPDLEVEGIREFLNPDRMAEVLAPGTYDHVLDCIDSITPKLNLISECHRSGIPLVSSMGAGGKTDPTKVSVVDISRTYNCKMAFQIRKRLRREYGISKGFQAVFSSELQDRDSLKLTDGKNFKKSFYGTSSFTPALFGLHAAAHVIKVLSQ